MSNVSKTNEALIAEAQQHYSEMNGLNSRAAEVMMELVAALESATRVPEQGEVSAAIERVRRYCENQGDKFRFHAGVILAALDGAPEPEWEERLAACDKHGTHCWSCKRYTERRRPAGDWHRLPVEGESND